MRSASPIHQFLLEKVARDASVKAHTRVVDGKRVQVKQHTRDVDDKPVEPAPRPKKVSSQERAAEDLRLWREWVESDYHHSKLTPLIRRFKPMVGERAGVYRGKVRIPDSAVDLAFQIEFVNALRSYDPSKAALGTHVYNSLSKGRAQRWIGEHQNIGRIPENRLFKIRQFQSAREEIAVREEPTDELLAKKLNWSIKEVGRMRKELRNDLVSQGFEDDPFRFVPSKDEQVLRLFKYELDGEQRLVYEHLGGFGRKKITKTKDLSKELDMPDYRVSRIKNQIASKLKRYVDAS